MANDTFQSKSDTSTPKTGFWAERDTKYLRITADHSVFAEPYSNDGNTGKIIEKLQTRGTIIAWHSYWDGTNLDDDSEMHVIMGHASGWFEEGTNTVSNTTEILEELKAQFTEVASGTVFEISVETKFAMNSDEASPLDPIA